MAYLTTSLPAVVFPHELSTLDFSKDTTGETYFRLTVDVAGDRLIEWKLHFASDTFRLHGLPDLLQTAMSEHTGSRTLSLWVMLTDGTWDTYTCQLLPCRHRTTIPATEYVENYFLTAADGSKQTYIGATEHLTTYSMDDTDIPGQMNIACHAVDASGNVLTQTFTREVLGTDGMATVDVSPITVASEAGITADTLAAYDVQLGARRMHYDIIRPSSTPTTVAFRGAWNQPDTFHFFGYTHCEVKVERNTVQTGHQTRSHNVRSTPEMKAHTGHIPDAVLPLFTDLCSTTAATCNGRNITLLEQEIITTTSPHAMTECTLTWRESEEGTILTPTPTVQTFDSTFDETFQ